MGPPSRPDRSPALVIGIHAESSQLALARLSVTLALAFRPSPIRSKSYLRLSSELAPLIVLICLLVREANCIPPEGPYKFVTGGIRNALNSPD